MNEQIADYKDRMDPTAGERSSKPNLVDIFLAQQSRLRRIAAGMGLGASDVEDVLQDVSIKALKGPAGLQTKEQSTPMADKSYGQQMPDRTPPTQDFQEAYRRNAETALTNRCRLKADSRKGY